ncbi:MAG: hypothetical protein JXB05_17585 [Myxococcaceae bacterium]|nr:hypothetical protein [Myxococcaceae bacterium]
MNKRIFYAPACALALVACGEAIPMDEAELEAVQQAADSGAKFGTLCQSDYQNNWRTKLPYVWNRCGWFNNELDDTDTKSFYWNLHGAKSLFEGGNDHNSTETVNLVYASTHGGAWSDTATYTMWDQNQRAFTKDMRLGNESVGLSILATYACETLKDDGKLPLRWAPTMRGGLRYVTGSFDKVYDSFTTDEQGEVFADELQHKAKIKYAWRDSVSDAWTDEDAAVMSTGTSESNCFYRLNNMTWQNYPSFPRLRDNEIKYYCRTFWSL